MGNFAGFAVVLGLAFALNVIAGLSCDADVMGSSLSESDYCARRQELVRKNMVMDFSAKTDLDEDEQKLNSKLLDLRKDAVRTMGMGMVLVMVLMYIVYTNALTMNVSFIQLAHVRANKLDATASVFSEVRPFMEGTNHTLGHFQFLAH